MKPKSKKAVIDPMLSALADLHEAVGQGFQRVHTELGDIRQQLDRIETIVLRDHQHRIEMLERRNTSR
ncbi:MAG: hypothetical protein Q7R62_00750 [bacterium]|nr:hypothetical protein [bacterium]